MTITAWLAEKGLSIAADRLIASLTEDMTSLRQSVFEIDTKLDSLIRAPYRAALMHYREDNLARCKESVVSAIAHDDWNLPAYLLYIHLLRLDEKYELALEYYWIILSRLDPPRDLVPDVVIEAFDAFSDARFRRLDWFVERSLELRYHDLFYPQRVYCSPFAIVTTWDRLSNWKKLLFRSAHHVTLHSWKGKLLMADSGKDSVRVKSLTDAYLVYERSPGGVVAFDIEKVRRRPSFDGDSSAIFSGQGNVSEAVLSPLDERTTSRGLVLEKGCYDYKVREECGSYSVDMPPAVAIVRHVGGQLSIVRAPR